MVPSVGRFGPNAELWIKVLIKRLIRKIMILKYANAIIVHTEYLIVCTIISIRFGHSNNDNILKLIYGI